MFILEYSPNIISCNVNPTLQPDNFVGYVVLLCKTKADMLSTYHSKFKYRTCA